MMVKHMKIIKITTKVVITKMKIFKMTNDFNENIYNDTIIVFYYTTYTGNYSNKSNSNNYCNSDDDVNSLCLYPLFTLFPIVSYNTL